MRHQRAAAGWSSGRGPAAAAVRTTWAASRPARARLRSLSASSGRNGSGRIGDFCSEQSPQVPVRAGIGGGESLVELLLPDSACVAVLGWPCRSQVAGIKLDGGAPHLHVGDQLGRQWSLQLGRPGWQFSGSVEADLVGELSDKM